MGRVKAMMMEQQEKEIETLQDLWITGSIKEEEFWPRLLEACNGERDEADEIFCQFTIEKEQYEEDNSQFGAGA